MPQVQGHYTFISEACADDGVGCDGSCPEAGDRACDCSCHESYAPFFETNEDVAEYHS